MNWTPANSIRTRDAYLSTNRVLATSGVCGSRPDREHRESGPSPSYVEGSAYPTLSGTLSGGTLFRDLRICSLAPRLLRFFLQHLRASISAQIERIRESNLASKERLILHNFGAMQVPLESKLVDPFVCVANKELTRDLSLLDATLTKNPGVGAVAYDSPRRRAFNLASHLPTLFQVPYPVTPLLATLTKTPGVWGYSSYSGTRHSPLPLIAAPNSPEVPFQA